MEVAIIAVVVLFICWALGLMKLGGQSVDAARELASNRIEVVSFESNIKKAQDMAKAHNNMGDALLTEYANAKLAAKHLRNGLADLDED